MSVWRRVSNRHLFLCYAQKAEKDILRSKDSLLKGNLFEIKMRVFTKSLSFLEEKIGFCV